jgi:hypothetical protein
MFIVSLILFILYIWNIYFSICSSFLRIVLFLFIFILRIFLFRVLFLISSFFTVRFLGLPFILVALKNLFEVIIRVYPSLFVLFLLVVRVVNLLIFLLLATLSELLKLLFLVGGRKLPKLGVLGVSSTLIFYSIFFYS